MALSVSNLDVLRRLSIGWTGLTDRRGNGTETVTARSGDPTVQCLVDGRRIFLHSSVDPRLEATRLADRVDLTAISHLVVLGFGLGYHVLELARRIHSAKASVKLIIVEADPDLLGLAAGLLDLSPLAAVEARILAGLDPSSIGRKVAAEIPAASLRGLDILVHPPSVRSNPGYYEQARRQAEQVANAILVSTNTIIHHSHSWQCNHILNLPHVVSKPGVAGLFGRFPGIPGFVVGAGPSLDNNVHQLKQAVGRSVIIACDTALKSLLRAGVKPDIVLSIDGSELNFHSFTGVDRDDITLVADPMTYHRILAQWRGPRLVSSFGSVVGDWVCQHLGDKGEIKTGGSVSTGAFHLAYMMGCNPIVFVGQDLSYPNGREYATGTFYDEEGRRLLFRSVDMLDTPGVDGGVVSTPRFMYMFIKWFEESIAHLSRVAPSLRVIDATEGGALIRGAELLPLRSVITRYCARPIDFRGETDRLHKTFDPGDVGALVERIQTAVVSLKALERHARSGIRTIKKFRQGHLTADRCRSALDVIDRRLAEDHETMALAEWFIQRALFGLVRRLNAGPPSDVLADNEQLYLAVAAAGQMAARLLEEALPRIRMLEGESAQ